VQSDGTTAYVIPRPDTLGTTYALCGDGATDQALAALVAKYDMCSATVQDPDVINKMVPQEALQITHALHQNLVFVATTTGSISPFAADDDVLAVSFVQCHRF
jgi:hypothetical protein